ncbi:MAG: hypothetical protein A2267_02430 [Omnitrophica WOR_2 bacterium RIFOXYA12_FULL_38_10]|nr:MAG: hypothetical protein A2267_02430 [Omnitrophica WOR_2 bacterium RIFOXYA12_FULL_38_10]
MRDMIIYGAFDRHNYGDLLFPLVLDRLIKEKTYNKIYIAGLINSDLTKYGSLKTFSIKKVLKESNEKAAVILGGGDIIGCDWQSAVSYLLPKTISALFERFFCRIAPQYTEKFIKRIFGVNYAMPFCPEFFEMGESRKIIYNSVGATAISNFNDDDIKKVTNVLNQATYISVRDNFSSDQIERILGVVPVLAPDSAQMMSELFTKEEIDKKTSRLACNIIKKFRNKYLVFQISKIHAFEKERDFAKSLDEIFFKLQMPIIFVAIGNATNHEDREGIRRVAALLDKKTVFQIYKIGDIFSIMNIIKNSKCYCGTSLHGLITAIAFSVPRVGLLPKLRKQVNYMNTWDLDAMPRGINAENLYKSVKQVLIVEKEKLIKKSEYLVNEYRANFERIYQLLE